MSDIPLVYPGIEYVSFVEFVALAFEERGWDLPTLHIELATWIEESIPHKHRLLQAFRFSGKSELLTLYVAWRLYLNPNYSCIIVSAALKLARRNSAQIRRLIETHPLTGHLVNDEDEWRSEQFNVKRPVPGLHHSVVCLSLGAKMTGFHGDEIIGDDIEVEENCRTIEARENIASAVSEMIAMADAHLFLGTPHTEDTIYVVLQYQFNYQTEKRKVWLVEPTKENYETGEGGIAAWPEQRGVEWILEKHRTLTTGKFRSQYLLEPKTSAESLIDTESVQIFTDALRRDDWDTDDGGQPQFFIGEHRIVDHRAYWDSATGLKGRHNSVVAAVARDDEGRHFITAIKKLSPITKEDGFDVQCGEVLDFCKANFVNVVYVECNFSITLASELKQHARERKHRIGIKESRRSSTQNKGEFIAQCIEPLVKVKKLYVDATVWKDTAIRTELRDFPHNVGKIDDHIDAVAGAIYALSPHRVDQGKLGNLHKDTPRHLPEPVVVNAR